MREHEYFTRKWRAMDHLAAPLRWRGKHRALVDSDLFHESLSFEAIDAVFGVMAIATDHTFLVLTKRPERAAEYFAQGRHELMMAWAFMACNALTSITGQPEAASLAVEQAEPKFPLPNVWLGTSAEDQATLDERGPHLLRCPAAIRFLSLEPLLGPLYLGGERGSVGCYVPDTAKRKVADRWRGPFRGAVRRGVDWVIAGGESGPGARPPHPDWFRSVRDQCAAARVPYFFKQWGAWAPMLLSSDPWCYVADDGRGSAPLGEVPEDQSTAWARVHRVGKGRAGALLDGREHHEWPEVA